LRLTAILKLSSKIFRTRQLVKRCLGETEEIRKHLQRLEAASALPFEGGVAWNPDLQERARSLLALISPVSLEGIGKVRLGGEADGGYVLPQDWGRVGGMLSLGIGPENSFDLASVAAGIEVQAYDFSISSLPQSHPAIHWHREKITAEDRPHRGEISLAGALGRFSKAGLLGVKMDIEGYEYPALLACPSEPLERILFLTGEFHGFASAIVSGLTRPMEETFQKLQQLFAVIHVHANNQSGCRLCGGILVPQNLELTWVNRKAYSLGPCQELFPTLHDRPNQPGKAELFLGSFQFTSP